MRAAALIAALACRPSALRSATGRVPSKICGKSWKPARLTGPVRDGHRGGSGVEVDLGGRDGRRRAGRAVGRHGVEGELDVVDRAELAARDVRVEVERRLLAQHRGVDQVAVHAYVEPGAAGLGEGGVRPLEVQVHRGDRDAEGVLAQLELLGDRAVAAQGQGVDPEVLERPGLGGAARLDLLGEVLRVGAGQAEHVRREHPGRVDQRVAGTGQRQHRDARRRRHRGRHLARADRRPGPPPAGWRRRSRPPAR